MVNILIGCTGSVATIKLPLLTNELLNLKNVKIKVIVTEHSKKFYNVADLTKSIVIYTDKDEWTTWSKRGDPVLHIDLVKWANIFLIAPLDANTLAKIANGICDNLLTCVARAWDTNKPLIFCPAMNTKMYLHPVTNTQLNLLESWGYKNVPVTEKTLMCGDIGLGAMAEIKTIVDFVKTFIRSCSQ